MNKAILARSLGLAVLVGASLGVHAEETKVAAPAEKQEEAKHPENVSIVDVANKSVNIEELVKPGHRTIVDVYSEACPPCRMIAPKLNALATKKSDLRVLKLDIGVVKSDEGRHINWKAPVIDKYEIRSIPYFLVYGVDGKLESKGDDASEQVLSWIKQSEAEK